MKALILSIAAVASCFSFAAFAACENPTMVSVPDGATATMDAMLSAQRDVKTYLAAMETYLACLNDEIATAGEDAPDEFKSLMTTRYNSAVGEMETVAAAYNQQLQAYKAAHPQ